MLLLLSIVPGRGKNVSFTMTARVAGSTHSVLLTMNVIFVKECEESISPTHWKLTFCLDWNFFGRTMTLETKSTIQKRPKRIPDNIVETTRRNFFTLGSPTGLASERFTSSPFYPNQVPHTSSSPFKCPTLELSDWDPPSSTKAADNLLLWSRDSGNDFSFPFPFPFLKISSF